MSFKHLFCVMVRLCLHLKSMRIMTCPACERFSCRISEIPYVRNLPYGISEDLGITKFVGACASKQVMSAVPRFKLGKLQPKTRVHVRPTTQDVKCQVHFFSRQCTSHGRNLQNDLKVDMVRSPRSCRKHTSKKGSKIGFTPS